MSHPYVRAVALALSIFALGICLACIRPAFAHGEGGEEELTDFLGENHPAVVHFPIALTLVAGLAEGLSLITRRAAFANAARFCIFMAALAAIAAIITGLLAFAEEKEEMEEAEEMGMVFSGSDEESNEPTRDEVLDTHRAFGIAAVIVIIATAVVSELGRWRRNKWVMLAYRVALVAAMILVAFTGYYGGMFVHHDFF
jgi:uncharacterized membrane protein